MKRFGLALALCLWAASAVAQVGLPFPGPGTTHASAPSFSLAYQNSAASGASGPTIDYGNITFTSGYVVVANLFTTGGSNTTITGIALIIGGVTTNLVQISGAYANPGVAFGAAADVWQSSTSLAGATADVKVTYGTAINDFGGSSSIALYSLVTTTPTGVAVPAVTPNGPSVSISSLALPSGGGGIALTTAANSSTGFSSITSSSIDMIQSVNQVFGHITGTGTPTITAAYPANDRLVLAAVAWAP